MMCSYKTNGLKIMFNVRIIIKYTIQMGLLITCNLLDMLKLMDADENKSKRLVSLMKKRGFIQPAFELYGGVAGLYDYGPLGGRLRRNVINKWLNHWISLGNIVEIDSPTITPEPVLKAS